MTPPWADCRLRRYDLRAPFHATSDGLALHGQRVSCLLRENKLIWCCLANPADTLQVSHGARVNR